MNDFFILSLCRIFESKKRVMLKFFRLLAFFVLFPYFCFSQSISIINPNGGESVAACCDYNIQWNASGTSNYFDIEYSIDNGVNWTSIASAYNTLNYQFSWDPPYVSTSNALIKITDSQDAAVFGISENVFDIENVDFEIVAPNGGETIGACTDYTISWTSSATSQYYDIDYSLDNGLNWT